MVAAASTLLVLAVVVVLGIAVLSPAPGQKDGRENVTMAYNLAKYGTLSHYVDDIPGVRPSNFREPAYPILLAGVLRLISAPDDLKRS